MRSIWNTQHADESSASVGICQINILRYGLREKNRFPVSAIHNNASLSLSHYLTLDDTPPPTHCPASTFFLIIFTLGILDFDKYIGNKCINSA